MDDVRDKLTDSSINAGSVPESGVPAADSLESDRRRPGRINPVKPVLVPLLRGHANPPGGEASPDDMLAGLPDDGLEDIDGTRMFAGIVIGTLLATPFWLLLGIVVWWALR